MTPPDRRRVPRPAGSPIRVETDGEGRTVVEGDAVTPRELHAHLANVYEKIDGVADKVTAQVTEHRVETERRFGRIEKLLLAVFAVIASPKLGGPELPKVAEAVVQFFGTRL